MTEEILTILFQQTDYIMASKKVTEAPHALVCQTVHFYNYISAW